MADEFIYEVDTSQWDTLFSELSGRQLKSAWKAGLRPSAKTIERGVLAELASTHPAANKYRKEVAIKVWSKGGGYTVGMSKGQLSLARSKKGTMVEYSHLYILRWLSAGTKDRYTKRGAKRGSITASHFFSTGVKNTIDPAIGNIGNDITKALQRAATRAKAARPRFSK